MLSLTPQVKIESSEGSISKYGEIEKRVFAVPGVDGADAYVVGQGMLSSGRGIGSVVARGVEPGNPAVAKEWGRFVTEGTLAALAKDYPATAQSGAAVSAGGGVAIGAGLAHTLKAKLGDRLRMVAPIISSADGTLRPGPAILP